MGSYGWAYSLLIGTLLIGLTVFFINVAVVETGLDHDIHTSADFESWELGGPSVSYTDGPRIIADTKISEHDLRLRMFIDQQDMCEDFGGSWEDVTSIWSTLISWISFGFFGGETEYGCVGYLELDMLTEGRITANTSDHLMLGNRYIGDFEWMNLIEDFNQTQALEDGILPQRANVCQMPWTQDSQNAELVGCTWYDVTSEEVQPRSFTSMGDMFSLAWETIKLMFAFDVDYGLGAPWDMLLNIFNTLVALSFILVIFFFILKMIPTVG